MSTYNKRYYQFPGSIASENIETIFIMYRTFSDISF